MTNPDNVGGLPELPAWMSDYKIPCDAFDGSEDVRLSDRMRAYGELCRAAPAGGEPNGKLVGWWNGITPGFDGMGMPSIRWGADAEDSRHDIPLYDGYNPIHYVTPVSAPAGGDALKRIKAKLLQAGAKYPVENLGTIESAVNTGLSIALLLVDGELDNDDCGTSVGSVACPECKAPGLLFECVACSHSNYPQVNAPAWSGEVVVPAIERMLVDAYAAGMNGDNFDMLAARRNLSALLRKLQQGAE